MTQEKATVTTGFNLERFTISQHENRYYCVSIPNYEGGSVVRAEVHDALLSEVAQLKHWVQNILDSGVEFEDSRISYKTMQIEKSDLEEGLVLIREGKLPE